MLSGRNIVLKPPPAQLPTNAASGPREGGGVRAAILAAGVSGTGETAPNRKPAGNEMDGVDFVESLIDETSKDSQNWLQTGMKMARPTRSV